MIIEQLQEKAGFSPIECSVADLLLEEGEGLRNQSARSIAAKLYTAPSTITRLCKRMGYSGYGEFRDLYLDELRYLTGSFTSIDANRPFNKDDESRTIAAKLGALYRETDCVIRASQQTRKAQVPTIALTSYGRSTLADSVDVTLRASSRLTTRQTLSVASPSHVATNNTVTPLTPFCETAPDAWRISNSVARRLQLP